jgi:glycosyltransferase involved in cell wall biosynthesis
VKILVLSFYYPPDLSAGSFRTGALVESLRRQISADVTIDVVTSLPNRYQSFTSEAPEHEQDGPVSVTRIALPSHRSGMLDQSKAFLAFARRAMEATRTDYDVVYATSSRLMTAVLGARIARRSGARLYLDIRDIFVDTIGDVAARPVAVLTRPAFSALERWAVVGADRVNLVSRGFASYFEARYPMQRFSYFTNGIDDEFLTERSAPERTTRAGRSVGPVTVLYAGNLGEGQGLHAILPGLARRLEGRVRFRVVGDGGRRRALEDALASAGVTNVELLPPVARRELIAMYREADVLFLHLNDHDAFKRVLPSKIFEYAALGKPVWAGVSGYAAEFIDAEVSNAAVFRPCDVEDAVCSFERLTIGDTRRTSFVARFSRAAISRAMAAEVLALAHEQR